MQFQANTTYAGRFPTNYDSVIEVTVQGRTAKTVVVFIHGEFKQKKIHTDNDGNEFIFPFGRYSMAPVIRADKSVAEVA